MTGRRVRAPAPSKHRSRGGEGGHVGPPLRAQWRQRRRRRARRDGRRRGLGLTVTKNRERLLPCGIAGDRASSAVAVMLFFYGYDGDSCSDAVSVAFAGGGFGAGGARLSRDLDR